MAKTYHFGRARRLVNAVMARLARVGLAGSHTYPLDRPRPQYREQLLKPGGPDRGRRMLLALR